MLGLVKNSTQPTATASQCTLRRKKIAGAVEALEIHQLFKCTGFDIAGEFGAEAIGEFFVQLPA